MPPMNSEKAAEYRSKMMAMISGEGLFDKIKGAASDFANAWDLCLLGVIFIVLSGGLWLYFMQKTCCTSILVWTCIALINLMLAASV